MPRYFMNSASLEGLEHMMMDPSRRVRDDGQVNRQTTEKAPSVEGRGRKEQK